jgi:glutamate synthase domain-containing protein 2
VRRTVKTGRDVAIAALLGAERVATCPTSCLAGLIQWNLPQDPELRKENWNIEHVINFMYFIAEKS